MDETKVTSTVYRCRSDENIFGELHGHFEIQNGCFQAKNINFLRDRKVIKNKVKWIIPSTAIEMRIFTENSMAILK